VCLALMFGLQAFAEGEAVDHLAALKGDAKAFCNMDNKARRLPETATQCQTILVVYNTNGALAAIENGGFGKVIRSQRWLTDYIMVVTVLTVEQVEVLRFDPRIKHMAPDFMLGPNGGFSSAGGGNGQ